jgi:hypothetical protein
MASKERLGSWRAYDVAAERGTMIPARDGVRLATDIYFPASDGLRARLDPFPALVERTPYDEEWAGDVYFGPDALDSYDSLRLRWFDHWLKQLDTGVMDEAAVWIFVMGTGNGRKIYDVLGRPAASTTADIGGQSANGLWRAPAIHPFICTPGVNSQRGSRKCDSPQPPTGSTHATWCPRPAAANGSSCSRLFP